jgi:uracil phosphoribosyltransferase
MIPTLPSLNADSRSGKVGFMQVHIADHPLISHKLSLLRDKNASSPMFRALTSELVTLLAYEATRTIRVEEREIVTPVTTTTGKMLAAPRPVVVPILRAGLGMLEGMVQLLPSAEVGFLGMVRNEETLQPSVYAERLPEDLSDRQCFILDPMLATGGSLLQAINYIFDKGATEVTAVCLLGSPEGLAAIDAATTGRDVTIVLGSLDEKLDDKGFIVPGLGDAGDRLYGTVG